MGRNRFVNPDVHRLELQPYDGSDDWIEIKRELSANERRRMIGAPMRAYRETEGESEISLDWPKYEMAKLYEYIVDWSFEDSQGKRRTVSKQAIDALDDETAKACLAAIGAWEDQLEAEKKVKKLERTDSPGRSEQTETS